MATIRPLLLVAALAGAAAARTSLRNWGSTPDERRRPLPGDRLIAGERGTCTMAVEIVAPAAAVWPWLAQMGTDRAGWYSWDRLDNGGRPSAMAVEARWTNIQQGDRLVTVPDRSWFDVAHVEPNRSLVLRASLDGRGRPFDPRARRPRFYVDSRWEFFLDPVDPAVTRLIVRSGGVSGPRPLSDIMDYVFWHPAHVVMQVRQLQQLRARCERGAVTHLAGRREAAREPGVRSPGPRERQSRALARARHPG
jgi:hypothetical protein